MASHSELTLSAALFLVSCPSRAHADKLQITSTPPGATVELDGVAVGSTPFEKDFPGGYFHKTRTSMVAPRASRGRAHQSQRVRHEGTQTHRRPHELDFFERP